MSVTNTKPLLHFKSATQPSNGASFVDIKTLAQFALDRFAIGLSVLCAVHCLATPVLLLMFPSILATFHLDSHVFHELLIWVVIPTSFLAIFMGCKRHKDQLVFALAVVGITVLTTTALFGHDVLGHTGEKVATLFAVSILALAHWRNYSLCRKNSCKH